VAAFGIAVKRGIFDALDSVVDLIVLEVETILTGRIVGIIEGVEVVFFVDKLGTAAGHDGGGRTIASTPFTTKSNVSINE